MKLLVLNAASRRFLLVLPAIVIPFLCLIFFTLGGGRGAGAAIGSLALGLNTELPKPRFDPKQAFLNKLGIYEKADHDSLQKKEWQRQDPYRRDSNVAKASAPMAASAARTLPAVGPPITNPQADEVLAKLAKLKQSLSQSQPATQQLTLPPTFRRMAPSAVDLSRDSLTTTDPKLEQINTLLDKVIRIQHPEEGHKPTPETGNRRVDEVLPADSSMNTIAAVLPDDQTLTAGTTIALRITDSIRVNGLVLPGGQLVYGVVSINNDRLLVHVTSLREDRNIFTTDLLVYDLDGLPGIHIPGVLSRDVAKQSADQGVNSLELLNTDPTIAAQAASAGIQTVKTFVGRKVRQVRVSVRAGYQVLLRDARAKSISQAGSLLHKKPSDVLRPPGFAPGGQILSRCRVEGVELALRAIALSNGCLWFGMEWTNRSPITYNPAYARWFIRVRHQFKRTAIQELTLDALYNPKLPRVSTDSAQQTWTAFTPFAIPKDKELIVEVGDNSGGRVLFLVIDHKQILKAKPYGTGN